MPIYDYVCRECGNAVEVIHAVDAPGPTNCTNCGGPMRKALSLPTIVFKGSGWAKKERSSATAKGGEKSSDDGASKQAADKPASEGKSASEPSAAS